MQPQRSDDIWREMLNFFNIWFLGISPYQLMLKIWCTFAGTLLQLTSKVLIAHDSVSDPQCSAGPWVEQESTQWCQEMSWMTLEDLDRFNMSISKIYDVKYIIPITSISEYLSFSAISMHFNNPIHSQALPEELLDDPPGYRLWTDHHCARKKQPSPFQCLNSCAAWDLRADSIWWFASRHCTSTKSFGGLQHPFRMRSWFDTIDEDTGVGPLGPKFWGCMEPWYDQWSPKDFIPAMPEDMGKIRAFLELKLPSSTAGIQKVWYLLYTIMVTKNENMVRFMKYYQIRYVKIWKSMRS